MSSNGLTFNDAIKHFKLMAIRLNVCQYIIDYKIWSNGCKGVCLSSKIAARGFHKYKKRTSIHMKAEGKLTTIIKENKLYKGIDS